MKDHRILHWAEQNFIPLFFVYQEIFLLLGTSGDVFSGWSLLVLLFSISFGWLVQSMLQWISKDGLRFYVSLALLIGTTVYYLTEYFCYRAYKTFFTVRSLLAGMHGVAEQYSSAIYMTFVLGFGAIVIFQIPVLLFLFYGRKYIMPAWKSRWKLSIITFLLALASLFLSPLAFNRYWVEYNFDISVRSFGLITGTGLEIRGLILRQFPAFDQKNTSSIQQGGHSDSQSGESSADAVSYGKNELPIDFPALANNTKNLSEKKLYHYLNSVASSSKNKYTGLFRGKNLILISAESFSKEVIRPDLTPTLYRLANRGIQFQEYYQPAWGGSTSSGEYSILTGLIPTRGVAGMMDTIGKDLSISIGNHLKDEGYTSLAYHNGTYDYYRRNETHPNFGYSAFYAMNNGLEKKLDTGSVWPSDEDLFRVTVEDYIHDDHFNIYYMTLSGHLWYNRKDNYYANLNYETVEKIPELSDKSEAVKSYYACQLELEQGLKILIDELEKAGKADDTVIVLSPDHYPYGLEKSITWGNDQNYLGELYGSIPTDVFQRDRNALIIWSGSLEKKPPIVVKDPVYSPDITPTLLNLFGLSFDSRLYAGRDVFSDSMPLVQFIDYSWCTDSGFYNAETGIFTPRENAEVAPDYIEYVKALVLNKREYSDTVIANDLFRKMKQTP